MSERALRFCAAPGCRNLVRGGRCDGCARERRRDEDAARPESHRFYKTYAWKKIRERQLRRDPTCGACRIEFGGVVPATDVDHIVPLSAGGTNAKSNLQSLCHPHHSRKTWREVLARRAAARLETPPAAP